jgi:uncharacterized protein (DUF924 family)
MSKSNDDSLEPAWVEDVIRFWFHDLTEEDWFKKSDAIDRQISERFLRHYEVLFSQGSSPDVIGARTALARVIIFDQFPRNMFRGTARAFAADPIARGLSRVAVERGLDAGMTKHERLFLYLPFEHSENAADQALSVKLIETLGDEGLTRYALAHKAIIDRFGRFPHRNAALGRVSTEEEVVFLAGPNSSF